MDTNKRITKVREWIKENQVDSIIVTDPANQFYLSGFKALIYSRPILLIIDSEETSFIIPKLEERHARENAEVDNLYVYYEHPDADNENKTPTELLKLHLAKGNNLEAKIALDLAHAPSRLVEDVKNSGYSVADISESIMKMRYIKDSQEIHLMKEAGNLVGAAVSESINTAAPGVSELEIDANGNTALFTKAANKFPEATIDLTVMTPSGPTRSVMPHVFSNTRRLQEGDVVIHTRQVGLNGYRAELERTFVVGKCSEIQKKAFEAMVKAQETALNMIKPGVTAKEIDLAARKVLKEYGFEKYAIHRIGHAIGISPHEHPYLRFDNSLKLEERMAFCIEPGIYIPDVGGFRHSDTVIVTADGFQLITDYPRDLASLTI